MKKHLLKFRKVLTNIACTPLIFISNNSELAARYLTSDVEESIKLLEINNIKNVFHQDLSLKKKKFFIAENDENINKESVLISEIIIEGWENHPEGRELNWLPMIL